MRPHRASWSSACFLIRSSNSRTQPGFVDCDFTKGLAARPPPIIPTTNAIASTVEDFIRCLDELLLWLLFLCLRLGDVDDRPDQVEELGVHVLG